MRSPFGHSDCESELQLLKSGYPQLFFDETPFSEAAMRPDTYLIVGRRGSGKTALAQYFSFQQVLPNAIVIQDARPAVYQEVLSEIASLASGAQQMGFSRLRRVWEYVLWCLIIEHTRSEAGEIDEACAADLKESKDASWFIGSVFKRLLTMLCESGDSFIDDRLEGLLVDDRFERARKAVLKIAARRPIIVAIDTLERYGVEDEGLMAAMTALAQCAADFNVEYSDQRIHLKLFMSGELFPYLVESVMPNPSKSVRNTLYLRWRARDLLRLISWRLYRYLFDNSLLPSESKGRIDWDDPEDVTAKVWRPCFGWEITNAHGFQERTFPYVLRHTQMRPRQMIYLCNAIASRAIRSGTFPRVTEDDIRLGVAEGQEDLAAEILNSYSTIYPHVSRITDALNGIASVVTGAELDRRAKISRSAWPPGIYSLSRFRQLLAELGIVGRVRARNDKDRYIDAEFEYSMTHRLTPSSSDVLTIHPMFYARFNVIDQQYRVMPFGRGTEAEEAEGGVRHYRREVRSFLRLSRRAESADRSKLVETFVSVGPLTTLLSTRDHQIIYGRRGTGKTHALLYLDTIARSRGDLTAYIDLRTVGSSFGVYSDPSVAVPERATRLLMDALGSLHDALHEQILAKSDLDRRVLGPLMDRFAEAITEVVVTGTVQTDRSTTTSETKTAHDSIGLSVAQAFALDVAREVTQTQAGEQSARVVRSGVAQHRVHFGRVGNTLREIIAAMAPRRIWVLLDEWSVVPADLQPFLADLIRRSLFPLSGLTVKLGSIEQRTHLRLSGVGGDYIGIEIGADAAADVNLDDFMVYENNPERATEFFLDLIFKHVQAVQGDVDPGARFQTPTELLRAFTHRSTFEELVRAAEGVPRDAINILSLAAQRAHDSPISMDDVRAAAKAWYQRDKEAAASANVQAKLLLNRIIDEVIGKRRTRGFLLCSDERHPLIDALFDARVLHILRRDISMHDQPGIRYVAYKIDYGCYVDHLTSPRSPRGLFFSSEGEGDGTYVDVPPDDYRAIRRAILDLRAFA